MPLKFCLGTEKQTSGFCSTLILRRILFSDSFRRNDSTSALLLLAPKKRPTILRKGFSEASARKELAEKLARLDSVSDSNEEDKDADDDDDENLIATDDTKGLLVQFKFGSFVF